MPRAARIVVPEVSHHVTQRGNNRGDVFFVDDDRRIYLGLLRRGAQRYGLRVEGYCLMTNHVHLVCVPTLEHSLARALALTNLRYTQYVNRMHGRSGRLWQNRFFSCPLDEAHRVAALCYVENNPVRAAMVKRPAHYAWSSAASHCGGEDASGLLDLSAWGREYPGQEWARVLAECCPESRDALRLNTRTGRPLGTDSFISKIETALGRRVRALPVGRPKGWRKKNAQ